MSVFAMYTQSISHRSIIFCTHLTKTYRAETSCDQVANDHAVYLLEINSPIIHTHTLYTYVHTQWHTIHILYIHTCAGGAGWEDSGSINSIGRIDREQIYIAESISPNFRTFWPCRPLWTAYKLKIVLQCETDHTTTDWHQHHITGRFGATDSSIIATVKCNSTHPRSSYTVCDVVVLLVLWSWSCKGKHAVICYMPYVCILA